MVSSFSVEDMDYFIPKWIWLGSDSSYNLWYIHINADQCVPVQNIADHKA